jgi:hypothetical protein
VSLALIIQHAVRMHNIVIRDLSGSTIILPRYLKKGKKNRKKKMLLIITRVLVFSTNVVLNISHFEEN